MKDGEGKNERRERDRDIIHGKGRSWRLRYTIEAIRIQTRMKEASSLSLLRGKQVDPDKLIKGRSHLTQTETIDTVVAAVSNR